MTRHPFLIFSLLLVSTLGSFVRAQTAPAWNENRMTWDPPTSCAIASEPLSRCPVASYLIERAGSTAGPFVQVGTSLTLAFTHIAGAGENCYRFRAVNAIAGASAPSAALLCRTNVEPAPPQIPPGPPTNARFVTVAATNDFRHNLTPVFRVATVNGKLTAGTFFGLVPIGRQTQGAPLFTYRKQPHCLVEVGSKELTGTADATNLAAPCAPGA
jgi:hypothetical protein